MSIINLLDEKTINKIATGEVIEKPASIVKELVENSIDAGSTQIEIDVKGGGIEYIKIADNGCGINPSDMQLAFLRHATSKLRCEADLNNINTLGFRGEALASIASISKVEMMSKQKNNATGYSIAIEGGKILKKEQCGCPNGTIITVTDVFYNTPARLKFLKSIQRETIYITNIIQNLALSNTDVSFKYRNNGKLIIATKGDKDLKSVILEIYGKNTVSNIYHIECSTDIAKIEGYIGNSNIAKGTRNNQSCFINGRYVKNKTISAAVETAYKSMITVSKFPFFVLNLYCNPEFVDVNVHPAKAEIKFQDEQAVFKCVYNCIRNALVKDIKIANEENPVNKFENVEKVEYVQQEFKIKDPKIYEHADKKPINENELSSYDKAENKKDDFNEDVKKVPKFGPLSIVGQVHFTYIIAEDESCMYIIDQHAAHERIYFEKYLAAYNVSKLHSQKLLTPLIIEMTASEKYAVTENINIFEKLGYEIEDFGGNSISLRSVPVIYGNPDIKQLFNEILNNIMNETKEKISIVERNIYTMACKSAVKAGDKLNYTEMKCLIDDLRICDNPYNCPHGRPTIIKITEEELEKKFKRIV